MNSRKEQGDLAESEALAYLCRQGLKPLTRNYRCRFGEIDLIMKKSRELIFVEVRFRGGGAHTSSLESIDAKKQQRLRATALHYLQSQGLNPDSTPIRFDVLGIDRAVNGYQINWVRNALC